MINGQCKLTHTFGKFVDAHIIPKAFTRHSLSGEPFIEAGEGRRPVRRFTSWYDNMLVTRAGEDILSKLDDWASSALRKHKIVWSGDWREGELPNHEITDEKSHKGLRRIEGIDTNKLRLFILSLLWRAAASERDEFKSISLPSDDLETIRKMICEGKSEPWTFYPQYFVQISTRGEKHNQTPVAEKLYIPDKTGKIVGQMSTYRFYFDGLITHIRRRDYDETFCLAPDKAHDHNSIMISTITFDESLQKRNLTEVMARAHAWPKTMHRLLKARNPSIATDDRFMQTI